MTHFFKIPIIFSVVLILSGCGGGGLGSDSGGGTVIPITPIQPLPIPKYPICTDGNPNTLCNNASPGALTRDLSGQIMNSTLLSGSHVTAYGVLPDGSNGEVLAQADTGTDGKFSMTLPRLTNGYVRFVATDVRFVSIADGTKQTYPTLQLIAPFVTVNHNYFVLTPITDIANHVFSYQVAKKAKPFDVAYNIGVGTAFGLSPMNPILRDDFFSGTNYLKTVPNSPEDALHTYQDELRAMEWFGMAWDLPSADVLRVVSLAAEADYPADATDGSGIPVNAGMWAGSVFNFNMPKTLDWVMVWKDAHGNPMLTPDGKPVHSTLQGYLSGDLENYFYRNAACVDVSKRPDFFVRYPNSKDFFDQPNWQVSCQYSIDKLAKIQSDGKTNNRAKYMQ